MRKGFLFCLFYLYTIIFFDLMMDSDVFIGCIHRMFFLRRSWISVLRLDLYSKKEGLPANPMIFHDDCTIPSVIYSFSSQCIPDLSNEFAASFCCVFQSFIIAWRL